MQKYAYCPKCSAALEYRQPEAHNPEKVPVCTDCGFIFWQNSKPTASAVLLNDAGEVLLVERAIEPKKGEWDLPGGFLANGEDPVAGMQREMEEELGIAVEPDKLLGIFVDTYGEGSAAVYTFNVIYAAKILSGTITPKDDVASVQWFTPSELPESVAFRNNAEALDAFLTHLGLPKRYGA
jgi:ADP-ribose pyrophosphatase YjhB (NUDIX family)